MRFLPLFGLIFSFAILPLSSQENALRGELAIVASKGDLRLVETLIQRGANPNQKDKQGETALIHAVKSGEYPVLKTILISTANPNLGGINDLTPLMHAVQQGREDMISLLLEHGADPNRISEDIAGDYSVSALSIAVNHGKFAIAHGLMQSGADGLSLTDSKINNPLHLPLCNVPFDSRIWMGLSRIKENANSPDWKGSEWALHRSSRDGDWLTAFNLLEELNANPNKTDSYGVTPLMTAAWNNHIRLVSLLLSRGALANRRDKLGCEALSYAVAAGNIEIVNILLEAQKSPPNNPSALEKSPWFWAVVTGRSDILSRLIDANLPLPLAGEEGISLLMTAAWMSNVFAVKSLTPLVQDAGVQDDGGRTALEWCVAAFDRDRGNESYQRNHREKNYAIARILARRTKAPGDYRSIVSPDIHPEVIAAWSTGEYSPVAEHWYAKKPSPVPRIPGKGDFILYRILRDEEP